MAEPLPPIPAYYLVGGAPKRSLFFRELPERCAFRRTGLGHLIKFEGWFLDIVEAGLLVRSEQVWRFEGPRAAARALALDLEACEKWLMFGPQLPPFPPLEEQYAEPEEKSRLWQQRWTELAGDDRRFDLAAMACRSAQELWELLEEPESESIPLEDLLGPLAATFTCGAPIGWSQEWFRLLDQHAAIDLDLLRP